MRRIEVTHRCPTPCAACTACYPEEDDTLLADVLEASAGDEEIALGGGDATRWRHLAALLVGNSGHAKPRRYWIEAPASAFDPATLATIRERAGHGVVVQFDLTGEPGETALGEAAVAEAERLGLKVQARICARPRGFAGLGPLFEHLAPRETRLELTPRDTNGLVSALPVAELDELLAGAAHVEFTGHRLPTSGFPPPCVMPKTWRQRPQAWNGAFERWEEPNESFPACEPCALRNRCHFERPAWLDTTVRRCVAPVLAPDSAPEPTGDDRGPARPKKREKTAAESVVCTMPWTTMELPSPDGQIYQCCANWTRSPRGNLAQQSLLETWNGEGYRFARRVMSGEDVSPLCHSLCPRLYDRQFGEERFAFTEGAEPFMQNQRLLLEDIERREEVARGKPLYLVLSPSSYCNYDCIMCSFGRSPRRDLPDSVWDDVDALLPTLAALTFLGGEPLASDQVMRFLRGFDRTKYPDCGISLTTNGSLLTEKALKHMERVHFAAVTLSLNAGTAETYQKVHRGIPFEQVLQNLDALLEFRRRQPQPFNLQLSFVVQPQNIDTILDFAAIAHARALPIRLLPLDVSQLPSALHGAHDYSRDPRAVAHVLEQMDKLRTWAAEREPSWLPGILATAESIRQKATLREAAVAKPSEPRPILSRLRGFLWRS